MVTGLAKTVHRQLRRSGRLPHAMTGPGWPGGAPPLRSLQGGRKGAFSHAQSGPHGTGCAIGQIECDHANPLSFGDLMRKAIVLSAFTLMAVSVLAPATVAFAAPPCLSNCVVTFPPGAQTTWVVPSNASDVSVVVAAGAGGTNTYANALGGSGGTATVDLGKAYNGQTLHVLAGAAGAPVTVVAPGGGGGGSYVAGLSGFIVIAGGGAGAGALSTPPAAQPGGAGGYSTSSADGGAGTNANGYTTSGFGAVGAVPGAPGTGDSPVATGGSGTASSVASDGTITPGDGGAPGGTSGYPTAQGGGGYAGGGGGSDQTGGPSAAAAGAGGGGSGYVASGLIVSATAANTGAGSITFTYSLAPTISAPTTSVAAGSASTAAIDALAPGTAFTVRLSGTNAQVAAGTIDANGDPATVSFKVPAGTSAGVHTLLLVVNGATVATSAGFTITTLALAATGASVPWWVGPGALALLALGLALLWLERRRRITA